MEIEYSESLGRDTRVGPWADLATSTYGKVCDAVSSGERANAARLARCLADEAEVIYSIYRVFISELHVHLRARGVDDAEVRKLDAQIVGKLQLPDGRAFDARRQWAEFRDRLDEFTRAVYCEDAASALVSAASMKETWRQAHDRDADHVYGLIQAIVDRFGEGEIGPMWERVLQPLFGQRYGEFDVEQTPWADTLESLIVLACEAMRGHLVGPDRTGDMELLELEDRFVLRFDPCGSGHRTIRGDPIEGTPPRMEPPYEWGVSEQGYSWNHYTKGVCHYCTHCMYVMEEMPIDRFGYPLRVVNPPTYPDSGDAQSRQRCEWVMFKDPSAIPEEYYTRVGRNKPREIGSRARREEVGRGQGGGAVDAS